MSAAIACDTFSFGGPEDSLYTVEPSKVLAVTAQTFGIGIDDLFNVEMASSSGERLLDLVVPSNGTQVERWTDDGPDGEHSVYLLPESFYSGDGRRLLISRDPPGRFISLGSTSARGSPCSVCFTKNSACSCPALASRGNAPQSTLRIGEDQQSGRPQSLPRARDRGAYSSDPGSPGTGKSEL